MAYSIGFRRYSVGDFRERAIRIHIVFWVSVGPTTRWFFFDTY